MRQGNEADWKPEKMLSAEMAVIKDKKELHFAYEDGKTKRVATEDDISKLSGQIEELEESGIGGSGGQPIVVKTASAMTDTTAIYLYMGEGETVNGVVYEYGYIYTYDTDTSAWANSGLYGKGKDGKDGSDANVTAENIKTALGYTPADASKTKGIVTSNGEEITLTVGEDIEAGQVITFKYKSEDGYQIGKIGSSMSTQNKQSSMSSGYAEDTVTIEEAYEAYEFTGCYFTIIPHFVGGSGLPEVTEADNNKIPMVVNGTWELVEVVDGNTVLFYADGNEVAY